MAKLPISFPVSPNDVSMLFLFSEGVPSFNDDKREPVNRARAHTVYKHLIEDAVEFRERIHQRRPGEQRPENETTAFGDYTEMCQAGAAVLNSAWARFAMGTAVKMGPGTRAIFETEMREMVVRVGKPGEVGLERMRLARMILEAPPPYYEPALKIHTFFPIRSYAKGRPWCKFIGKEGLSGQVVYSLPVEI